MTLTLYVQIKCFSCSDFLPYEILGATSPLWAANSAGSRLRHDGTERDAGGNPAGEFRAGRKLTRIFWHIADRPGKTKLRRGRA